MSDKGTSMIERAVTKQGKYRLPGSVCILLYKFMHNKEGVCFSIKPCFFWVNSQALPATSLPLII